jgi:gamma-glutamylaminecyclotransferase
MRHRVFVYGTLLSGEVNHPLLTGATLLGTHRTQPCFTLYLLGAYPGLVAGGRTAVTGEVYSVDDAGLRVLDRLEDAPRLYQRRLISTPYGRAWVYLYRDSIRDRPALRSGDWRLLSRDGTPVQAAAVRRRRDPKNPSHARRLQLQQTPLAEC